MGCALCTLNPGPLTLSQGSPPKIPPGATLNFEVALLSWRSVNDIMGDGGVIKTMTKESQAWEKPGERDELSGARGTAGVLCMCCACVVLANDAVRLRA